MKVTPLAIPDIMLLEPKVFADKRGYFFESFNAKEFSEAIGRKVVFVQDNESQSIQGVLRGLHYQVIRPLGALVRVTHGEIFDVAVDIRRNSPTFGRWVSELLSSDNKRGLWIPEGFAHGFRVLSLSAVVQYKMTDYWFPEHERCIRFDDPDIHIEWPLMPYESLNTFAPLLSDKDKAGANLKSSEMFD